MKVLLINPQCSLSFYKSSIPSVGLTYIGTMLKNKKNHVKIVDSSFMRVNPYNEIENFKPDIVGIYCSTYNYLSSIKIAKFAKERGITIVAGGPHVSLVQDEILKNKFIDFGIIGDGEFSFLKLVNSFNENTKYNKIPGLIFINKERIIKNKPKIIKNLDKLPFPDYSLLGIKKLDTYPISTSRGCIYNCIFCSVPIFTGKLWRCRSPKNVIEELKKAKKKYNFKRFIVVDDNFNFDVNRSKSICKLLISENINSEWFCLSGIRADKFDDETGHLMKLSGCKRIAFGIESGDKKIFKSLKKGETLEQIKKSVKICKKIGIHTCGFFIIGLPNSDKESELKSLNLVKELDLDSVTWSLANPFPKTKLYEMVKSKLIKTPLNSQITYSWNVEPFFENDNFSKDEIKKTYIINNLKTYNYFIYKDLINMINLILNLRYDLSNFHIHLINISKNVIKILIEKNNYK